MGDVLLKSQIRHLQAADRAAWDALYVRRHPAPIWHALPFLAALLARFQEEGCFKLLDAACGDGGQAMAIPDSFLVVGVDQSPHGLVSAEHHLSSAKKRNYVLIESLLEKMPLPDASLDGGLFIDTYLCFPDPTAVLAELWRVLKPGSPLVVTTFSPDDVSATESTTRLGDDLLLYKGTFLCRHPASERVVQEICDAGFRIEELSEREDPEGAHPGFREENHAHGRVVIVARKRP